MKTTTVSALVLRLGVPGAHSDAVRGMVAVADR